MRPLVVVLPVCRPDFHLGIKFIRWVIALRRVEYHSYDLIALAAASLLPEEVNQLRIECSLTNNFRVIQQPVLHEYPELGYAAAANYLFREALEIVEQEFPGSPMLWSEADCVPTRPSWFSEIASEYAACGKPFLGAFHGVGPIPHMSGNAVYPADWRTKAPSLAALPGPNPGQGWDSACARETVPQMAVAKTIQQAWITPPFSEYNTDRIVKKETALFHRTKDGTLIDVLAKRLRISPIPLGDPVTAPTSVMGEEIKGREPNVAILIVTYAKDIPFLRYCLASIKKYASGFSAVMLVVPEHERAQFDWVRDSNVIIRCFDEPAGRGMLAHMVQKCRADHLCEGADFIVHLDADCMFFRKVTPAAYVEDNRCLSVRESYEKVSNPNRHIWRKCVLEATGIDTPYEYMTRHPQVHPRSVYQAMREVVESWTKQPFEEFVLAGQNQFPQSFAEFPTLSAVGRHLFACSYRYVDYDKAADVVLVGQDEGSFQYAYKRDTDFLVEWWSHGGIDRYKSDCDAVLAGKIPAYWVK